MSRRKGKEESTILLRFHIQVTERIEVGPDCDAEFEVLMEHEDGDFP